MRDLVTRSVPALLGFSVSHAQAAGESVDLQLRDGNGSEKHVRTNHVIAATGYRVDLSRLTFLDPEISSRIRVWNDAPVLSRAFESSVGGLHFVGLPAAHSFGPSMRFLAGADYTARTLASHIARSKT
jgi:hypothetical protein